MDGCAPPPVYSPPTNPDDAPPPFEPGPAAPKTGIDSKPAFEVDIPPPTRCTLPPTESISQPTPPPTFTINQRTISPFDLVTPAEVQSHLTILGAFARLQAEIKSLKATDSPESTDEKWAIYVARAVDRFAAWVSHGLPTNLDPTSARKLDLDEVPPLDVLMAWHTYMLNPRVYYEDGVAKKSMLLGVLAFPFNLINKIIDVDTLTALHPSQCRQERFESLTGQPWTCPPNTNFTDTVLVPCPRCEDKTLNEVLWIKREKTGFAENDFKVQCRTCMGVIDRITIMVRAVCDDIFRVLPGFAQRAGSPTSQTFISGTLLNWRTGQPDYEGAVVGNKVLLKHFLDPGPLRDMSGNKLAKSLDYSVKKLESVLKEALSLRDGGSLVTRILSYYRCPYYPFSIELCGAILRQGSFIDKLSSLGWIEPRTFDRDPTVIYRCIARYHAWLEVMSQVSHRMLVPTLDIDLVWHTHQLKQQDYRTWTLDVMGEFVDHDDKVEENKLSDAYDQTAEYWEKRWGIPYHVCGCVHPPQDKPFDPSEKLSRIFRGKSKHPEFTNSRPHLVSTHDCESGSTHPSEHNSIVVVQQTVFENRREDRKHKHEKWAKQLHSDVDKGKVLPDGWEAMSMQRAAGHGQGFMRPVPDSDLAPIVPYGPETCAAHQGGVLNGADLPSTPMDGKHSAGTCAVGMGLYGMPPSAGFHISPTDANPELFATVLGAAANL